MSKSSEWPEAPHISTPLPGPNATQFIGQDEQFSSPSYTRDFPLVVKRAKGVAVEDVDGNVFLDFAAGIAVCATGHCHPDVVEAVVEQSRNLIHICGSDFYYPSMSRLLELLAEVTPGDFAKRILLTNSGAECAEAALKLARYHTGRKWLIGFYGGFHGRTMGALSLTSSKARQKQSFGPFVPMVAHAPYGDTEFIENVLFKNQMAPEEVAAIFVEPILGEGGYRIPDPGFLPKLREICDRHGIMLVCDEIQSGIGRTGKMFAVDHVGVVPDILLSAKGLASGMPLGAVIASEEIMDWPPGAQGSTYGGNPVACASAVATIELVRDGLCANAAALDGVLKTLLRNLASDHACIKNPRSIGLWGAVDVVHPTTGEASPQLREKILYRAFEHGMIILPCGKNSIRFCPPLIITEAQLAVGFKLLGQAVSETV